MNTDCGFLSVYICANLWLVFYYIFATETRINTEIFSPVVSVSVVNFLTCSSQQKYEL